MCQEYHKAKLPRIIPEKRPYGTCGWYGFDALPAERAVLATIREAGGSGVKPVRFSYAELSNATGSSLAEVRYAVRRLTSRGLVTAQKASSCDSALIYALEPRSLEDWSPAADRWLLAHRADNVHLRWFECSASGAERAQLVYAWHKSIEYGKRSDGISLSQFVRGQPDRSDGFKDRGTGHTVGQVRYANAALAKLGYLKVTRCRNRRGLDKESRYQIPVDALAHFAETFRFWSDVLIERRRKPMAAADGRKQALAQAVGQVTDSTHLLKVASQSDMQPVEPVHLLKVATRPEELEAPAFFSNPENKISNTSGTKPEVLSITSRFVEHRRSAEETLAASRFGNSPVVGRGEASFGSQPPPVAQPAGNPPPFSFGAAEIVESDVSQKASTKTESEGLDKTIPGQFDCQVPSAPAERSDPPVRREQPNANPADIARLGGQPTSTARREAEQETDSAWFRFGRCPFDTPAISGYIRSNGVKIPVKSVKMVGKAIWGYMRPSKGNSKPDLKLVVQVIADARAAGVTDDEQIVAVLRQKYTSHHRPAPLDENGPESYGWFITVLRNEWERDRNWGPPSPPAPPLPPYVPPAERPPRFLYPSDWREGSDWTFPELHAITEEQPEWAIWDNGVAIECRLCHATSFDAHDVWTLFCRGCLTGHSRHLPIVNWTAAMVDMVDDAFEQAERSNANASHSAVDVPRGGGLKPVGENEFLRRIASGNW